MLKQYSIFIFLMALVIEMRANDFKRQGDVPTISAIKKRADAYWKRIDGSVDYLSLTGGTLTGSLYGTSAYFLNGVGLGINGNTSKLDIFASSGDHMRFIGRSGSDYSDMVFYANDNVSRLGYIDWSNSFMRINAEASIPMLFHTSSIERLRITSSGHVGIGTNDPSYKLEAVTAGKLGFRLQTNESTVGNPQLDFLDIQRGQETVMSSTDGSITGTYLASYSNHPLMFGTNHSSSQILLATNGNLGIGTTSPVSKLHVNGDITVASGSRVVYDPIYDVHGYTKYDYVGSPEAALLTYSYYGNRFQTRNGVAMVIKGDNNNIGIGTISPSYKLEAVTSGQGGFRLQTSSSTVGNPQIDLFDASKGQETVISSTDGSITGTYLASYSNHPLMFGTNHSPSQLLLATNGNLGVGTTSPSEKLSVNGNVKARKIIVSQTGWPDYVFAPSYSLRSLSEVEKFIAKNKHLPDMPSAKEVEEKGISVGDNQALLLKKIEELTLYIIDLQKQINQLKQNSKK